MRDAKDLMRAIGFVAGSCLLVAAESAQLEALIRDNVQSATSSYAGLTTDKRSNGSQLWIHVRSEGQRKLVTDKMTWFKSLQLGGMPVQVRPIQLVGTGPGESQLRYFKHEDRDDAEQLRKELATSLSGLQLQDLSGQYQNSRWLKSGHFELWLSPTVAKLTAP